MKKTKKLQIGHLEANLINYQHFPPSPLRGWIGGIRGAMSMSLRQLGQRIGITAQSAQEMEERERNETITLKSLRDAASALNMKLVYGFLPMDGSFEKMLEKQALIVARAIVSRTDNTMKLEDQQVGKARFEKAVKELAEEIKRDMPRYLWD